jgi:hypothetical protein
VLREDLGGEDIVYLMAGGESLTMVDRDHVRGDDLDQQVTVSIFPRDLAVFDAATGYRLSATGHQLAASDSPRHSETLSLHHSRPSHV